MDVFFNYFSNLKRNKKKEEIRKIGIFQYITTNTWRYEKESRFNHLLDTDER